MMLLLQLFLELLLSWCSLHRWLHHKAKSRTKPPPRTWGQRSLLEGPWCLTVYVFELRLDNIQGSLPLTMYNNLGTDLASHVFSQGWPEQVSWHCCLALMKAQQKALSLKYNSLVFSWDKLKFFLLTCRRGAHSIQKHWKVQCRQRSR